MAGVFEYFFNLANNLRFLYVWMPMPILNMFTLALTIIGAIIVINIVAKILDIIK